MKKKTFENLKRALALVLCAVMIGNVVQLPTVTVHAETEGTSEGGETSGGTNTASGSALTISDEETTATSPTIEGHVLYTDDSDFGDYGTYAAFALMTAASGEEGEAGDSAATTPGTAWDDTNGWGDINAQWSYGATDFVGLFSNGTSFLNVAGGSTYYSKLTAAEASGDNASDASYATLSYTGDASGATGFYAVGPISQGSGALMTAGADSFTATLPMPNEFTQTSDRDPGFLSPYMYMYGSKAIEDGACAVDFQHVPAVLRFIITNKRPDRTNILSVSVSVSDGSAVASDSVVLSGTPGSADGYNVTQTLSDNTHSSVTTKLGETGTEVEGGDRYIAYALVLPLDSEEAFKGKTINLTIKTDSEPENEYLAYKLDAELLATANGGVYNWVGGKSYTFRISLDDIIEMQEVTVTDWVVTEIDGGIAEEVTESLPLTDATCQSDTDFGGAYCRA